MGQIRQIPGADRRSGSRVIERSPFVRAIQGESTSSAENSGVKALTERQELERLARFSSRHADGLRSLKVAESDTRRDRQRLGWCAQFSTESEAKLRNLLIEETGKHRGPRPAEQFTKTLRETWDASKHPRGGYPENRGWWSPAGGGSGGTGAGKLDVKSFDRGDFFGTSTSDAHDTGDFLASSMRPRGRGKGRARSAAKGANFDPSTLRLPRQGSWGGDKGVTEYTFKKPIRANRKLIHKVEFKSGVPDLHPHSLRGNEVTIILTGDSKTDRRNAMAAWKRLHPNTKFPENVVFHHDMLNVTDAIGEIDGKKVKAFVGTMQLIPKELHEALAHEGSASAARHFYDGIADHDMALLKKLAKKEASVGGKVVSKAAKKIVSGTIPKKFLPLLGRGSRIVTRVIPFATTGWAIANFANNAEARGIPMALAEATPLLGDIIGVYDFGSDLAKEITDEATAKMNAHERKINEKVFEAREIATRQTMEAFRELAAEIEVTNEYSGPNGLVDAGEVSEALMAYRNRMLQANWLRSEDGTNFDYEATASDAKRQLKQRLMDASQRNAQPFRGPAT